MLHTIIWNNSSNDVSNLPEKYKNMLTSIIVDNYNDLTKELNYDGEIFLIIAIISPSDIDALYNIKQLQKKHPSISLLAIFNPNPTVALESALDMLLKSKQNDNSISPHCNNTVTNINENSTDPSTKKTQFDLHTFNTLAKCHLTPRQGDVLNMILKGKSNKEIARLFGLSEGTIKVHCMAIFKELDVTNRTQAAILAEKHLKIA